MTLGLLRYWCVSAPSTCSSYWGGPIQTHVFKEKDHIFCFFLNNQESAALLVVCHDFTVTQSSSKLEAYGDPPCLQHDVEFCGQQIEKTWMHHAQSGPDL